MRILLTTLLLCLSQLAHATVASVMICEGETRGGKEILLQVYHPEYTTDSKDADSAMYLTLWVGANGPFYWNQVYKQGTVLVGRPGTIRIELGEEGYTGWFRASLSSVETGVSLVDNIVCHVKSEGWFNYNSSGPAPLYFKMMK